MKDSIYAPHEQRVIDERDELKTKVTALDKFITGSDIFKSLEISDRNALCDQLDAMEDYLNCLEFRIYRFEGR